MAGGVAAAVLFASVALSAPAEAHISQCSSNRACAWFDVDYSGTFGQWSGPTSYLSGWNDLISSSSNRRTHAVGWFTDSGYSGNPWVQYPNESGSYIWPHFAADSFSSLWFYA
ncbi:peptidase inhibitor family I36 protein [Arthrobacter sp. HMWF013]|uniref:peptidase inhibitor family I36 protein n=1 Tax=Arthrobacter sp. HMWF013 TaxID=2056849 RepID=UPI0035C1BD73